MPVRSSKRPRDPNQLAKLVVDLATGEEQDETTTEGKNPAAVALGPSAYNEAQELIVDALTVREEAPADKSKGSEHHVDPVIETPRSKRREVPVDGSRRNDRVRDSKPPGKPEQPNAPGTSAGATPHAGSNPGNGEAKAD